MASSALFFAIKALQLGLTLHYFQVVLQKLVGRAFVWFRRPTVSLIGAIALTAIIGELLGYFDDETSGILFDALRLIGVNF